MPDNPKHEYATGIRIAWEQNRIRCDDPQREFRWQHDHLSGTMHHPKLGHVSGYSSNGNALHKQVRTFLQRMMESGHIDSSTRFLEIGCGAGVAAYEAHRLIRPSGGTVETVNLTPVNPYLGIPGLKEINERLKRACAEHSTQSDTLNELRAGAECGKLQSIEDVRSLTGAAIYDLLDEPYIARQWIGAFPEEAKPEGEFDIIYESHGGLRYSMTGNPYNRDAMEAVTRLLSPRGILMIETSSFAPFYPRTASDIFRKIGESTFDEKHSLFIGARPEHPLYMRAAQSLDPKDEQRWSIPASLRYCMNTASL